jgi:hypothetical protein
MLGYHWKVENGSQQNLVHDTLKHVLTSPEKLPQIWLKILPQLAQNCGIVKATIFPVKATIYSPELRLQFTFLQLNRHIRSKLWPQANCKLWP